MTSLRFCAAIVGTFVATVLATTALLAEEEPADEALIEATFIVPYGETVSFKEHVKEFFKKEVQSIDLPGMGISIISDRFTQEEISELKAQGHEAPAPLEVSLFDGAKCGNPSVLNPGSVTIVPPNVCRVVGATPPVLPSPTPTVWIIDSGVDAKLVADGLLKVTSQVDCVASSTCAEVANAADKLGHGTMIAGIVGGIQTSTGGTWGITGVSPNAPLNIVKVFDDEASLDVWAAPIRGLVYVASKAAPGDIVNISWGGDWLTSAKRNGFAADLELIDKLLHYMADKQVRIVIAAGNADAGENDWPWVQTFMPANSGSYLSQVVGDASFPKGAIYSVSAANSTNTSGNTWTDKLWRRSAFGASKAEPGVKVLSLWTSDGAQRKQNVCSGTSFAAPVLAGLLVRVADPSQSAATNGPLTGADKVGFNAKGHSVDPDTDHPKCS